MATAIRMRRGGRTHAPYYRVVVVDSRKCARGRVLDEIGVYHPCARPEPRVELDRPRALEWLSKGAQPSDTVRSMFRKTGVWAAFKEGAELPDAAKSVAAVSPPEPAAAPPETGPEAEAAQEADVETSDAPKVDE